MMAAILKVPSVGSPGELALWLRQAADSVDMGRVPFLPCEHVLRGAGTRIAALEGSITMIAVPVAQPAAKA